MLEYLLSRKLYVFLLLCKLGPDAYKSYLNIFYGSCKYIKEIIEREKIYIQSCVDRAKRKQRLEIIVTRQGEIPFENCAEIQRGAEAKIRQIFRVFT